MRHNRVSLFVPPRIFYRNSWRDLKDSLGKSPVFNLHATRFEKPYLLLDCQSWLSVLSFHKKRKPPKFERRPKPRGLRGCADWHYTRFLSLEARTCRKKFFRVVGWRTASSASRPISRPCAHPPFRDPLTKFRAYHRILLSQRYTTAAGKSDRRSAKSFSGNIHQGGCEIG